MGLPLAWLSVAPGCRHPRVDPRHVERLPHRENRPAGRWLREHVLAEEDLLRPARLVAERVAACTSLPPLHSLTIYSKLTRDDSPTYLTVPPTFNAPHTHRLSLNLSPCPFDCRVA